MIDNEAGLIRIGEFAQAVVDIDVTATGRVLESVYDPQLAGKWISPLHPHIVSDQPGTCPICGEDLVPASELGFVSDPPAEQGHVVIPRSAVLISGDESVAYVETEPGRYEFRQITAGQVVGEQVAIISGIESGEMVVINAPFMLDAAFNMAGKPSLIDPTRNVPEDEAHNQEAEELQEKIDEAMSALSEEDRRLAIAQRVCPIADFPLGGMGTPVKVMIGDQPVFLCCDGCSSSLLKDPDKYLAKMKQQMSAADSGNDDSGDDQ